MNIRGRRNAGSNQRSGPICQRSCLWDSKDMFMFYIMVRYLNGAEHLCESVSCSLTGRKAGETPRSRSHSIITMMKHSRIQRAKHLKCFKYLRRLLLFFSCKSTTGYVFWKWARLSTFPCYKSRKKISHALPI